MISNRFYPSEGTLNHRPGSEHDCTGHDQASRTVFTDPLYQFVRQGDGRVERQEEDDEENRQVRIVERKDQKL